MFRPEGRHRGGTQTGNDNTPPPTMAHTHTPSLQPSSEVTHIHQQSDALFLIFSPRPDRSISSRRLCLLWTFSCNKQFHSANRAAHSSHSDDTNAQQVSSEAVGKTGECALFYRRDKMCSQNSISHAVQVINTCRPRTKKSAQTRLVKHLSWPEALIRLAQSVYFLCVYLHMQFYRKGLS